LLLLLLLLLHLGTPTLQRWVSLARQKSGFSPWGMYLLLHLPQPAESNRGRNRPSPATPKTATNNSP
jgi:hypothetical protein